MRVRILTAEATHGSIHVVIDSPPHRCQRLLRFEGRLRLWRIGLDDDRDPFGNHHQKTVQV